MNGAEVLERIEEILPYLRDHADEAEQLRKLPDETAKRLKETGVVRLLQPARWKGYEADPRLFFQAIMKLASACGASGWVCGVAGVHPWELAAFEPEAQAEVWGDDPDTWISSSYMPTGSARPVDGGYVLSGRWGFSSGSTHCEWVLLGGTVCHEDGSVAFPAHFLVPRPDYRIEDTWHVVGLSGTGSNDIVVEEAFLPAHRVVHRDQVHACNGPGLVENTAPCFRVPWGGVFPNAIASSVIGISEGALQAHLDYQSTRVTQTMGAPSENPIALDAIGRAAAEIESARTVLLANVGEMYSYVQRSEEIPLAVRARNRRDQVHGSWRCVEAVDMLMARSGGNALRVGNPIQRFWRDAHAGVSHVVNVPDKVYQSWSSVALGNGPLEAGL